MDGYDDSPDTGAMQGLRCPLRITDTIPGGNMRRTVSLGTVLLAASLAGCSSSSTTPVSSGTAGLLASPSAQPTVPTSAECSAVKAVVEANMPALENSTGLDGTAGQTYYQQLVQAIQANGGTDPVSTTVLADAVELESDYTTLSGATNGLVNDPSASAALQSIVTDLGKLTTDQVTFDQDCGLPAIVPS